MVVVKGYPRLGSELGSGGGIYWTRLTVRGRLTGTKSRTAADESSSPLYMADLGSPGHGLMAPRWTVSRTKEPSACPARNADSRRLAVLGHRSSASGETPRCRPPACTGQPIRSRRCPSSVPGFGIAGTRTAAPVVKTACRVVCTILSRLAAPGTDGTGRKKKPCSRRVKQDCTGVCPIGHFSPSVSVAEPCTPPCSTVPTGPYFRKRYNDVMGCRLKLNFSQLHARATLYRRSPIFSAFSQTSAQPASGEACQNLRRAPYQDCLLQQRMAIRTNFSSTSP